VKKLTRYTQIAQHIFKIDPKSGPQQVADTSIYIEK